MKKKLIIGVVAFCLSLGGSVTAFAASGMEFPFAKTPDLQMGTFQANMENRMADFEAKAAEMKEKADASMSVYEQHGLVYNEDKDGYCYDGKLVGLLVDPQGRGISYLNKNGEVHIKAIRNENGEITTLAVLSEDEYNKIITQLDGIKANMQERMDKMHQSMEKQMSESRKSLQSGSFDPSVIRDNMSKTHEAMQEEMRQFRLEMEQRLNNIE